MKKALLPVVSMLVISMLAACAKDDGGDSAPITRHAPTEKPEGGQGDEGNLPAPQGQKVDPKSGEQNEPNGFPGMPEGGLDKQQRPLEPGVLPPVEGENDKDQDGDDQAADQNQKAPDQSQDKNDEANSIPIKNLGSDRYTGAGNDGLREYLMDKIRSADKVTRERNEKAAARVDDVRFMVDLSTGQDVNLFVRFREGKTTRDVYLNGQLDENRFSKLLEIKDGEVKAGISGTVQCLDQNARHCFVARIRLVIGKSAPRAIVNIISRKTTANFVFASPLERAKTQEFQRLVRMFDDTTRRAKSADSIRNILISTFEVLTAKSKTKISIITRGGQIISANSRLVANKNTEVTNVKMNRDLDFKEVVDLQHGKNFKTNIHESITDLRLVGNDGQSRQTLGFTVGRGSQAQDLVVTFVRQQPRIMTFHEIGLIEKANGL